MRTRLQKAVALRNLLRRPAQPALGRGRLQILCRRAILSHGGTISTSLAIEWCYRQLQWQPKRKNAFNVAARRALASVGAVKAGWAAKGPGRSWAWEVACVAKVLFPTDE